MVPFSVPMADQVFRGETKSVIPIPHDKTRAERIEGETGINGN